MYGIKLDSLFYQSYIIVIKRTYSLIFFFSFIEKAVQHCNLSDHYTGFQSFEATSRSQQSSKYIHKFLIVVDQWFNLLLRAS